MAGSLAGFPALAQDTETDSADVFELSPFVVSSEDSDGYLATNTLAGTRLKTNLNEVGTAITIITEEFLDDTGITDASTLLTFTPNTEVGGEQGNFAGGVVTGRVDRTTALENPQGNQRVRGLSGAQLTRDYFRSVIPFDRYNTTRITLNRGPNSILFGTGSVAGVVNNTTKKAMMTDMPAVFSIRVDGEGGHRETLDFNKVIIEDRLAVRVDFLNENLKYQQDPAFEDDRRAFIAVTGIIREGGNGSFLGKTSIRANAEVASSEANPPNPVPPNDGFREWFNVDHTLPKEDYVALGATVPGFLNNFAPKTLRYHDEGIWGKTVLGFPYYAQLGVFYTGQDNGAAGFFGEGSEYQGGQGSGLPGNAGFQTTRAIYANNYPGFTEQVVTNRDIFDYEKYLLTGDLTRRYFSYDVQNVALEQLLWDGKAGIELVWDNQASHRESFFPFVNSEGGTFGNSTIGIDIQRNLPYSTDRDAGSVDNPNVGRPIIRNNGLPTRHNWLDRETLRATSYLQVDAKDYFDGVLGSLLGNHTITGVYSEETSDNRSLTSNLFWGGNVPEGSGLTSGAVFGAAGKGEADWQRQVVGLAYVGESALNANSPDDVRLHPITARLPQAGDVYTMYYKDRASGELSKGDFMVKEHWQYGWMDRTVVESWSGSLHSKFFNDHVITLLGYRYDQVSQYNEVDYVAEGGQIRHFDEEVGTYTGPLNVEQMRLDPVPSVAGDHSLTYSVVVKFPEHIFLELPFDSDLNLFYNYSDSFDPTAGIRLSAIGDELAPPRGETREYGFMLDMFKRKISIRANWFETTESGRNLPGMGQAVNWSLNNVSRWMKAMADAEDGVDSGGTNPREFYSTEAYDPVEGPQDAIRRMYSKYSNGVYTNTNLPENRPPNEFVNGDGETVLVTNYDQMYELINTLLPEPVRSRLDARYDRASQSVLTNDLGGRVATVDTVASGFELEVTGNPTRGLRLMANVSFQETTLNNVAPVLGDLVEQVNANINRSGLRNLRDAPDKTPGTTYYGRYEQGVTAPLGAAQTKEGQVSVEQRQWRVNLVANYKFRNDSRFKGFGIGGGFRYQSKIATGYPQIRNEDNLVIPVIDDPFWDPSIWSANFWGTYNKKLRNGVDMTLRLSVWNALGTDEPSPVRRNPDGALAVFRYAPPPSVSLTCTLKF
jgi:hypothetical protein